MIVRIKDLILQERDAKTVFDLGGFSKALIAPTPMGAGYLFTWYASGREGKQR